MENQTARSYKKGIAEESKGPMPLKSDQNGMEYKFMCQEDQDFWQSLEPTNAELGAMKKRSSLKLKLQSEYGLNDAEYKLFDRFICDMYKTSDNKDFVYVRDFIALTRWFGTLKKVNNECYLKKQIELLRTQGGRKVKKSFESWFAGKMDIEEAKNRLHDKAKDTFLVRFSESLFEEGGFSVAVKTSEIAGDVQQYQIKANCESACQGAEYNAQLYVISKGGEPLTCKYHHIVELVDRQVGLGFLDGETRIKLKRICPKLPLNATFQGYS